MLAIVPLGCSGSLLTGEAASTRAALIASMSCFPAKKSATLVYRRPSVSLKITAMAEDAGPRKQARGITMPKKVSPAMQIWAYIKKNDLQDPENRKIVVCDEKLKSILGGRDRVGFLEMSGLLNPHFVKDSKRSVKKKRRKARHRSVSSNSRDSSSSSSRGRDDGKGKLNEKVKRSMKLDKAHRALISRNSSLSCSTCSSNGRPSSPNLFREAKRKEMDDLRHIESPSVIECRAEQEETCVNKGREKKSSLQLDDGDRRMPSSHGCEWGRIDVCRFSGNRSIGPTGVFAIF